MRAGHTASREGEYGKSGASTWRGIFATFIVTALISGCDYYSTGQDNDLPSLGGLGEEEREGKVYDIAEYYYETIYREIRDVNPNHLILWGSVLRAERIESIGRDSIRLCELGKND